MLTLHAFAPAFGEPSPSPFCVKAMCLLTMAGVDWRPEFGADIRAAPRKKFPVLVDGDHVVPDSSEIQSHLETAHGAHFNAGLSAADTARSHAVIRMAEEHLYHACVYDRWVLDENWAVLRKVYFSFLPFPLRLFVPGLVRKDAIANIKGQGIGRLSYDDMVARASQDLDAIDAMLGDDGFLFGDTPTAADASVGPLLAAIAAGPIQTAFRDAVLNRPKLMAYVSRVRSAIYPDMSQWT